jgi:protein SCO1
LSRGPWLALAAACVAAHAQAAVDPGAATAPRSEFVAPAAGTYQLQRIQGTPDAAVLDASGRAQHLARFTHGKITLLTFFYTYCADPLGCPFARVTLSELRSRVLAQPELAPQVRFVNVTLDPGSDTPAALGAYAMQIGTDPRFEWRFLTTRTVADLLPLLEDLGQDVSVETDAAGRATRTLHHMLKVFLIDRRGTVREIYSLAYLQPDVMFNDIRTLALEAAAGSGRAHAGSGRSRAASVAQTTHH